MDSKETENGVLAAEEVRLHSADRSLRLRILFNQFRAPDRDHDVFSVGRLVVERLWAFAKPHEVLHIAAAHAPKQIKPHPG